jgi:hypothetical protein
MPARDLRLTNNSVFIYHMHIHVKPLRLTALMVRLGMYICIHIS